MIIHENDVVRLKDGRTTVIANVLSNGFYLAEFVADNNLGDEPTGYEEIEKSDIEEITYHAKC
ncbi:hypothetical protein [Fructobacillus ficulneus]|uniref:Uncharacterized protein n=1 Tax=Fructobacillus ficulneus TaxID=157463 RepID=A0A0K8MH71_9LACO|nr:hypothetical protein [Fructobacillus ficulneus]GAO99817.1 hypothetical protein FFIC_240920 [Fructobacillus ficulneus]